jgi:hypothetical protein
MTLEDEFEGYLPTHQFLLDNPIPPRVDGNKNKSNQLHKLLKIYRDEVEEIYREDFDHTDEYGNEGYPEDWKWRAWVVRYDQKYVCANKRCSLMKCLRQNGIFSTTRLHVDHILPISEGGTHDLENLQALCSLCHSVKHPENEQLQLNRFWSLPDWMRSNM